MAQATWNYSESSLNEVALTLAAFALLVIVAVLVYNVFRLAGTPEIQQLPNSFPAGFGAYFPL
jgi:hypothetical protein